MDLLDRDVTEAILDGSDPSVGPSFPDLPVAPEPFVTRCGHALKRTGFELAPRIVETIVRGEPALFDRLRSYPRTGTLDGMDTCDRDMLLAAVAAYFLDEPWTATCLRDPVALRGFLNRLVVAVTARRAWA